MVFMRCSVPRLLLTVLPLPCRAPANLAPFDLVSDIGLSSDDDSHRIPFSLSAQRIYGVDSCGATCRQEAGSDADHAECYSYRDEQDNVMRGVQLNN